MSEYSELIKNYAKIRDYIRDFYIYGFRSRDDYSGKSNRSYDNEKRRIESYLGDILYFRQEEDGKKVFLTADSAELLSNPFYKSFKTKSFTKNDISLHFAILYVLKKHGALTLKEMLGRILKEVLDFFEGDEIWDEATLRNKWFQKYTGIIGSDSSETVEKEIRKMLVWCESVGLDDYIAFKNECFQAHKKKMGIAYASPINDPKNTAYKNLTISSVYGDTSRYLQVPEEIARN